MGRCPTSRCQEFTSGWVECKKIGQMPASPLVDCGVEFEMNLVESANEVDAQL